MKCQEYCGQWKQSLVARCSWIWLLWLYTRGLLHTNQDTWQLWTTPDWLWIPRQWETIWQMEFRPNKGKILNFTCCQTPKKFPYSIHSQQLPNMPHKYLSITPYINTKFNTHTDSIQHKANRTLGLLRRNLHGCARHKTHNLQHICISNTLALRSRVGPTHTSKY